MRQAFRGLPPELAAFGKAKLFGMLSPLLLVSIAVALALSLPLPAHRHSAGEMLAAGAKPEAAELSGVRVGRAIVLCHILSGVLAAIAAAMLAARHGAAIPSMAGQLGQDWLLPAFLAPVLGGTLLSGGRVSVLGTLLGAMLVSMLTNGLLLLRVGEFWVQACLGLPAARRRAARQAAPRGPRPASDGLTWTSLARALRPTGSGRSSIVAARRGRDRHAAAGLPVAVQHRRSCCSAIAINMRDRASRR